MGKRFLCHIRQWWGATYDKLAAEGVATAGPANCKAPKVGVATALAAASSANEDLSSQKTPERQADPTGRANL